MNMDENKQDVPAEISIAMAVSPVQFKYEAWRVVAYRPDGSYYFVPNNKGDDYKLKHNAEKEARRHNNWCKSAFAVVKRVKVSVSEVAV